MLISDEENCIDVDLEDFYYDLSDEEKFELLGLFLADDVIFENNSSTVEQVTKLLVKSYGLGLNHQLDSLINNIEMIKRGIIP